MVSGMSGAERAPGPWMFGAVPDLLLGCGIGYALLAGGLALLPVEPSDLLRWGTLATFVTGMPHYGATLLRVYEDPLDRRKYAFFTLWASLAVWLAFVAGVYAPLIGSLMATVYVTWSPWHYTGQNYGLAVLFLRRRGVAMSPALKRPLYASFILSFALTFLILHGANESAAYVPIDVARASYHVLSLRIPPSAFDVLFGALLAAHAVALAATALDLGRRAGARAALPAVLLLLTQAAWFTVPSVVLWASGARIQDEYVVFYFLWAGVAHAVQYLWITTYYAAAAEPLAGRLRYLGKTLLAGGLVFALPALVFAPGLLGTVPYETGLWLLVAAAVNLQHFILDGAIWKLRDGPVARILLAEPATLAREPIGPRGAGAGWLRGVVWSAAAAGTVLMIGSAFEYELGWIAAKERDDHERARVAEKRLVAVGRDNPLFYQRRAELDIARGDAAAAMAEYERSLALFPTPGAWYALGVLQARQGEAETALASFAKSIALAPTPEAWTGIGALRQLRGEGDSAALAFERALELDSRHVPALHLAGRYWLERGSPERGRAMLERAISLAPDDEQLRADLRRAGE
jgi:hypothetical protein